MDNASKELSLAEYIKSIIEQRPKNEDIKWLADQIKINPWTFYGHFQRDSFSAIEMLKIAKILNIDLNELKHKIEI